jgi:hypothetical protein
MPLTKRIAVFAALWLLVGGFLRGFLQHHSREQRLVRPPALVM